MKWLEVVLAALAVPAAAAEPTAVLLKPDRVFDGVTATVHSGWQVLVREGRIEAVGPGLAAPAGARTIDLPGTTLMPGMIEGHGHLFLHPYNEAKWDAQVLNEPLALRTAGSGERARHAAGRLHDRARPGHGRGRLCRRRAQAGDRWGHRAGAAPAGRDQGDRGARCLRTQGLRAGRRDPPGSRGSERGRRGRTRRAQPDCGRGRRREAVRRLSLAPARTAGRPFRWPS